MLTRWPRPHAQEIRELGYPGSSNLLVRYLNQGHADAEHPHLSPRRASRILLTRPDNRTGAQRETAERLASACPEMTALDDLVSSFAAMLVPGSENEEKLQQQWIAAARAVALPHLHSFTRGLELDLKAATAAVTLPHHNGRTEGGNTKTKKIKRDMLAVPASNSSATASCSDKGRSVNYLQSLRALTVTTGTAIEPFNLQSLRERRQPRAVRPGASRAGRRLEVAQLPAARGVLPRADRADGLHRVGVVAEPATAG